MTIARVECAYHLSFQALWCGREPKVGRTCARRDQTPSHDPEVGRRRSQISARSTDLMKNQLSAFSFDKSPHKVKLKNNISRFRQLA